MTAERDRLPLTAVVKTLLAAALLIAGGYWLARYRDHVEQTVVAKSSVDDLVVALRQNRNRLEVYDLGGTVTTHRRVTGGIGDILWGEITVRQPWRISYFVEMGDLGLDDYIWDERARTLLVRAPAARPDPPALDASRQIVATKGPLITRDMQDRLRSDIAVGARQQAKAEGDKPENIAAANAAARAAIAHNLEAPLAAAGLKGVTVIVQPPEMSGRSGEQWDVSRSLAEVLKERSR